MAEVRDWRKIVDHDEWKVEEVWWSTKGPVAMVEVVIPCVVMK